LSTVEEGNTVKVHYTGKLKDGQVFDTSEERDPIEFEIGAGQMIPGFEKAVVGMEIDESKTVEIESDEAYGDVNDELFLEVPKSELPDNIEPEVGMQLQVQQQEGQQIPVQITEVKDSSITLDANPPLAGKDLVFDIKVVDIK